MRLARYNKTAIELAEGETFEGVAEECYQYKSLTITCKTDGESTLIVYFGQDRENFDTEYTYAVTANVGFIKRMPIDNTFFKINLVNGSDPQTYLRLNTILSNDNIGTDATTNISSIDDKLPSGLTATSNRLLVNTNLDTDISSIDDKLPSGITITSGGLTVSGITLTGFYKKDFGTSNTITINNTSTNIYSLSMTNLTGFRRYVHIYNLDTTPVLNSSTPTTTFIIEPNDSRDINFGGGVNMSNGLGLSCTSDITGALSIEDNEVLVYLTYNVVS